MSTDVVVTALDRTEDTFCLAVIEYGGNLAAAYRASIDANEPFPIAKARELLARPEIAHRINYLTQVQDEHAGMSFGSHLQQLANIRDLAAAKENFKVALDAETARYAAIKEHKNPRVPREDSEGRPVVQILIGQTPANVNDWGTKYGQQPVVIEAVEKGR